MHTCTPTCVTQAEPGQLNLIKSLVSVVSPEGFFPGGVVLALSRTKMYRHHVPTCDPQSLLGHEVYNKMVNIS